MECPWVSNVPSPLSLSPWKKSNFVFIRPRNKASVQRFCAVLKFGPLEPTQPGTEPRWLLDSHSLCRERTHQYTGECMLSSEGENSQKVVFIICNNVFTMEAVFPNVPSVSTRAISTGKTQCTPVTNLPMF